MNVYLLALVALIAAFAVGFIIYGQLFKRELGTENQKLDITHLSLATVGIYISMLGFVYTYDHLVMGSLTGVSKGFLLGLLVGVAFFAIPFMVDSSFLSAKKEGLKALTVNWLLSFAVAGIVVGLLR